MGYEIKDGKCTNCGFRINSSLGHEAYECAWLLKNEMLVMTASVEQLHQQLDDSQALLLMLKPLTLRYIRLANQFYECMVAWMSESTDENKAAWESKAQQFEEAEKALQGALSATPAQAGERRRALEDIAIQAQTTAEWLLWASEESEVLQCLPWLEQGLQRHAHSLQNFLDTLEKGSTDEQTEL